MDEYDKTAMQMNTLVVFHALTEDPVIAKLMDLLKVHHVDPMAGVKSYTAFVAALFEQSTNLTEYLFRRITESQNSYVSRLLKGEKTGPILDECLRRELLVLEEVSRLSAGDMKERIGYTGYLPEWETSKWDFHAAYAEMLAHVRQKGIGMYAFYHMFTVRDGKIIPVKRPDPVSLSDLKGYEMQRQQVIDNTEALLAGKPASNVLLYGDAGTGKSSTVKAIVNDYAHLGLRLIEIPKKQLACLHEVTEVLSENPLKFVIFIDDLSFSQENDDFYALKALLEGSVYARLDNMVIYATGNRRHLIKERFSDREGDEVHRNETIQELTSLSARFGLTVGFFRPNRETYLKIVHELKEQYQIQMEDEELYKQAEWFAVKGRSPRVARQFIEQLRNKI